MALARRVEEVLRLGYQKVARTHRGGSAAGYSLIVGTRPEVGGGVFVCRLLGERLVFACAADGEVAAFGAQGCGFVAVGGYVQFVGDSAGQAAGERYAFFQGDAGDGDQGKHVGRAHAGMLSVMLPHVYDFRSLPDSGEGGFDHGLGFAHEGDYGAVGGLSGVNVEDLDSA